MKLVLGSSSPRRKEILEYFSIPFIQKNPDFDEEKVLFQKDPKEFVKEIAFQKAQSLVFQFPEDVILTSDTTVFMKGEIFSKPKTMKEAFQMLKKLSGKDHFVYTGVCVMKKNESFLDVEESKVFFQELTDAQIQKYITAFNPLDKAGAYAIQRGGSLIVKRIEGCYYNIMGLPTDCVRRLLLKAGIDLWEHLYHS